MSQQTRSRLRIVMAGLVDSPHIEHLALALTTMGHEVRMVGEFAGGIEIHDLSKKGVERTAFDIPKSRLPGWRAVRRVRLLRAELNRSKSDLVHAHYVWYYGLFALLAGASPLVVSAWGTDVLRATRFQNFLNRIVVRRADLVLADSVDLLERVRQLGAPSERAALVNWGVDLKLFSPGDRREARRKLNLGDGPVILSTRELHRQYNPRAILDAFALIAAARPDARLVMKHQRVETPDLGPIPFSDRVHFVGGVPYDELVQYYRAADVCVSVPSSDSSPRTVWEAMASGCPCVVSDLPWVHEMIVPNRHALVTPIVPEEIAATVSRVLDEPELADTLREEGRELVERERSQTAEMNRLVALYDSVATGGQSARKENR